jgi:hypothetical protein
MITPGSQDDGTERRSLDPTGFVTSTYEVRSGPHVVMTVRVHGKTAGNLVVDAEHAGYLRDMLMPSGHTTQRATGAGSEKGGA